MTKRRGDRAKKMSDCALRQYNYRHLAGGKYLMLSLRLLGSPQITLNNQTIRQLPAAKSQALLFYLACRGRVQSRLALGRLLWPDKTDAEARMNLRQALYQLRQTLPNVLETSRESIAFGANAARLWMF